MNEGPSASLKGELARGPFINRDPLEMITCWGRMFSAHAGEEYEIDTYVHAGKEPESKVTFEGLDLCCVHTSGSATQCSCAKMTDGSGQVIAVANCVSKIGPSVFRWDNTVNLVTFGASSNLTTLHGGELNKLQEISIPDSVVELGGYCFKRSRHLRSVRFGVSSQLEKVGDESFSESGIESICLPDHVRELGKKCFYECCRLRHVVCSKSSKLERLGDLCFALSSLEGFSIPSSVWLDYFEQS